MKSRNETSENRRDLLLKRIALPLLAVVFLGASTASGALVITDVNISSNHYVYNLSYNDMANSTKFDADVFLRSNVSVYPDGAVNLVVADQNTASAFLTYSFDFTTTSYRPTSLSLTDKITLFYFNSDNTVTAQSSYSVDGINWTLIRSATTTGGQTEETSGTSVIDLSSLAPDRVFYRVTYIADVGVIPSVYNQWNRVDSSNVGAFNVDFTVAAIPEPSSIALLTLSGLAVVIGVRRRHDKLRKN